MAPPLGARSLISVRVGQNATSTSAPRHARAPRAALGYQPALDGLRGVAVVAVLLYHGGVSWAQGGFLGVDLFFVLSGFLITWLLLTEHETTGRISIRAFYGRRARRLFPALALVLIAVAGYALWVAQRSQLDQLQGDLLGALGYITNWRLIGQDRGYFDAFAAPSPLQHTWSVAVEEQWYLVWPPVMVGLLALGARLRARWLLGAMTVAFCAASWALTMALAGPGIDPSRVYYGTDTRAHQLLLGALLAIVRHPAGVALTPRWRRPAAVGGAGALLWMLWLATTVNDRSGWLFDGGLGLVAIASCAAILAAVQPSGRLVQVLSLRPLRAIGMVSYGLYLWHYPVFVVLSASRTGLTGTTLLLARLAATTAVALVSYRLIERPIRDQTVQVRRPAGALAGGLAVALAATLLVTAPPPQKMPAALAMAQAAAAGPAPTSTAVEEPRGVAPLEADPSPATPAAVEPASTDVPGFRDGQPAPQIDPGDRTPRVLVMGDSVALTLQTQIFERATRPDALVWNLGTLGCPLSASDLTFRGERRPDNHWCAPWRADRSRWIAEFDPDVVVVLSGVWDSYDRIVDGRELSLGSPEHDQWFSQELDALLDLLTSGGGRVVLATAPCNRHLEGVDGAEPPENSIERVTHLNELYRQAADRRSDTSLADLYELVCPGGEYSSTLDGHELRFDGVHFTTEGGELVRGWILEQALERRPQRGDL